MLIYTRLLSLKHNFTESRLSSLKMVANNKMGVLNTIYQITWTEY